ncbi:MAG: hypothetical protein U5L09_19815 [Bacteroidales bacterium]|nr:hypothetical protein [Bacteroidales bacterium]
MIEKLQEEAKKVVGFHLPIPKRKCKLFFGDAGKTKQSQIASFSALPTAFCQLKYLNT